MAPAQVRQPCMVPLPPSPFRGSNEGSSTDPFPLYNPIADKLFEPPDNFPPVHLFSPRRNSRVASRHASVYPSTASPFAATLAAKKEGVSERASFANKLILAQDSAENYSTDLPSPSQLSPKNISYNYDRIAHPHMKNFSFKPATDVPLPLSPYAEEEDPFVSIALPISLNTEDEEPFDRIPLPLSPSIESEDPLDNVSNPPPSATSEFAVACSSDFSLNSFEQAAAPFQNNTFNSDLAINEYDAPSASLPNSIHEYEYENNASKLPDPNISQLSLVPELPSASKLYTRQDSRLWYTHEPHILSPYPPPIPSSPCFCTITNLPSSAASLPSGFSSPSNSLANPVSAPRSTHHPDLWKISHPVIVDDRELIKETKKRMRKEKLRLERVKEKERMMRNMAKRRPLTVVVGDGEGGWTVLNGKVKDDSDEEFDDDEDSADGYYDNLMSGGLGGDEEHGHEKKDDEEEELKGESEEPGKQKKQKREKLRNSMKDFVKKIKGWTPKAKGMVKKLPFSHSVMDLTTKFGRSRVDINRTEGGEEEKGGKKSGVPRSNTTPALFGVRNVYGSGEEGDSDGEDEIDAGWGRSDDEDSDEDAEDDITREEEMKRGRSRYRDGDMNDTLEEESEEEEDEEKEDAAIKDTTEEKFEYEGRGIRHPKSQADIRVQFDNTPRPQRQMAGTKTEAGGSHQSTARVEQDTAPETTNTRARSGTGGSEIKRSLAHKLSTIFRSSGKGKD